ncbi:MAG: IPT/TIG domain-containing protein, partial [Bacillota bacterium]
MKKIISIITIIFILSLLSMTFGLDIDEDTKINRIRYIKEHDGTSLKGSRIEIQGQGLSTDGILLDITGEGFSQVGTDVGNIVTDSETYIKLRLNASETNNFRNEISLFGESVEIDLSNMASITNIDKESINIEPQDEDVDPDQLKIDGENLTQTTTSGAIEAEISPDSITFDELSTESVSDDRIVFSEFNTNIERGLKNVLITKDANLGGSTPGDETDDLEIEITNEYQGLYRLIADLPMELTMYPNTGGKGDVININGDEFEEDKTYEVYFLEETSDFNYETYEKGEIQSLEIDVDDNGKDRLSVKVPENDTLSTGEYYVKVVEINTIGGTSSGIVAEKFVENDNGEEAIFTLIGSSFRPTIDDIDPASGPDVGSNTEITGKNILTLRLPNLKDVSEPDYDVKSDPSDDNTQLEDDSDITDLKIKYEGKYDGKDADITREIKIFIGDKAVFRKDSDNEFRFTEGENGDILGIRTSGTNDADVDPFKDVILSIDTKVEITSTGDTYTFSQEITKEDEFEYIPSSLDPEIESVLPEKLQMTPSGDEYKFTQDILYSIKGKNFLVEEVVEDGVTKTRYPTILFKKDQGSSQVTDFQLGFFPQGRNGDGESEIVYKKSNGAEEVVSNIVEMTVLDDENNVVNGTDGNKIGNKILLKIPNEAKLRDLETSHLQVTNLTYGSSSFGGNDMLFNAVEFVQTDDNPIIESVDPTISTVEGGINVTIEGTNFQEDVKVILDGEEIEGVNREIDSTGEKIILDFEAPPNRVCQTQLQVINPSGGIDVWDFEYINTFDKDPTLEDFSPKEGPLDTLVTITGNNYLKRDPTVGDTTGSNAYRLIGTRVFLDGKDVNDYNIENGNINFKDYTQVPNEEDLIKNVDGKAVYSRFKDNTFVTNSSDGKVTLTKGKDNLPVLVDNESIYTFQVKNGNIIAVDESSNELSVTINQTSIEIDGSTYTIEMNNKILRRDINESSKYYAELADYAQSVILKEDSNVGNDFYILNKDLEGNIILTNGKDERYEITYDAANENFVATDDDNTNNLLEIQKDKIILNDENGDELNRFNFKTPYTTEKVSDDKEVIIGNRVKVNDKNKISFRVPFLTTGRGYKDIFVENPDTKSAGFEDENGFYYIEQVQTDPIISSINPNKGSVEGGYDLIIKGSGFQPDSKVIIDGVESENVELLDVDGTELKVTVPPYSKNLSQDYDISELPVSVVVLNNDGGNDAIEQGFTYVIPPSEAPLIEQVILDQGSSIGGDTVEIIGQRFKFAEPYKEVDGNAGYNPPEDILYDLYTNGKRDDLLKDDSEAISEIEFEDQSLKDLHDSFFESPILPKVYFGGREGRIVDFAEGYLKVITPPHDAGSVDLYLINNDYGVSNITDYEYVESTPSISSIVPDIGRRQGQETKDIYGQGLQTSIINGYIDDDASDYQKIDQDIIGGLVRFANISNLDTEMGENNSGQINGARATVALDGGLTVGYNGTDDELDLTIEENGKIYKRTFENYDDKEVYIAAEMLKNSDDKFYVPFNYEENDGSSYTNTRYEMIRVFIKNRRLFVERGYAPEVDYNNATNVVVKTPSYYTIGDVEVSYINPDGGTATNNFEYTNPASDPKILRINRNELIDETGEVIRRLIYGTINAQNSIEIVGKDFRDGATVTINGKDATIKEFGSKDIDGDSYDYIVARIPQGEEADIGKEYAIIVTNEDSGLANSSLKENLLIPVEDDGQDKDIDDDGDLDEDDKVPFYLKYQKPLSGPQINQIIPEKTSVYGGNTIRIEGSDFRTGAYIIIGSAGGVPIDPVDEIDEDNKFIEFTTPKDLNLGTKDVQVINEDYGVAILEDGIEIISYPKVDGDVYDENNDNEISRVSIEGGDVITVRGEGFQEGANVYFGGNWKPKTDDNQQGPTGLFRDDTTYIVENSTQAQSVEWIDSETLKVTTPEIREEEDFSIVVINPDTGISNDDTQITYKEPIPSDPVELDVELIDDRYIKLFDYQSDNADYFEIYFTISDDSKYRLKRDDYRDFKYIDTTEIEPYKITNLEGIESMDSDEELYLVLKAVNKYGVSNWSNIVSLDEDELEDVEEIGPPDEDGGLEVPEGQDYEVTKSQNETQINLANDLDSLVVINKDEFDEKTKRIINIPADSIRGRRSLIYLDFEDLKLKFTP